MATKKMAPKVSATGKLKHKQNKQPTQVNPKGIRVMILRGGKIKWGWKTV